MIIEFPNKVLWHKTVTPETTVFSGKKLKRLRSLEQKTAEYNISHTIEPLSEDFLTWFIPEYERTIGSKENGKVFDVRARTLENSASPFSYFAISLWQDNVRVAGLIFSDRPTTISVAFKVADPDWREGTLQLGPSLYVESLLYDWALHHDKALISMGMDANPYGAHSAIGLAEYKIAAGYLPLVPKTFETLSLESSSITDEILVFCLPESGRRITEAYLIQSTRSAEARIFKYPETVRITAL